MKMDKENQLNLTEKLKNGDKNAFNDIFAAYWKEFYLFALKATNSPSEAEDLVQDSFIDLWIKREQIAICTSVKQYIFGIIKNKLYDKIRRERLFVQYAQRIIHDLQKISWATPEQKYVLIENQQILNKKIDLLPERCREIFILNKFEDLSINEIAEKLKLSKQTVKNQLTNAVNLIKPHWQKLLAC
ncbi:MAG: RNA polymerase sigma-70 factor [Bacteroidales bacterium]|nr:RNA polymerase sigma-70 factor [Bacteroidales bacterium]